MSTVAASLAQVTSAIIAACEAHGRPHDAVQLIAVSKTKPAEAVAEAAAQGQRHFGENYLQEALEKQSVLAQMNLKPEPIWHFIGAIQSNKTRDIANHFDWVHTIEREKIARRLSEQRDPALAPLNLLIQVNLQNESTKAGVAPDEIADLAGFIDALPNVRARGLMAIPAPSDDPEEQRKVFEGVASLQRKVAETITSFDTLSMGMTNDMDAAIAAGATFVRIGTAVFGAREG